MTVYVTCNHKRKRGSLTSYMFSDSNDNELHAIAQRIDTCRFFNSKNNYYELTQRKKHWAIKYGAVCISPEETIDFICRNKI